jgi:hypothetical protein
MMHRGCHFVAAWHVTTRDKRYFEVSMIEVSAAITLFLFGAGVALFCIVAGTILHMRWLDRKLIKPVSKQTQQLPAVKP